MEANQYQRAAGRTLISNAEAPQVSGWETRLLWNALGLAGEAGEVADTIKKAILHQHGVNDTVLIKELGDVLWYVAALCSVLGIEMGEVMAANLTKLEARYPTGWDAVRSQQRNVPAEDAALSPPLSPGAGDPAPLSSPADPAPGAKAGLSQGSAEGANRVSRG